MLRYKPTREDTENSRPPLTYLRRPAPEATMGCSMSVSIAEPKTEVDNSVFSAKEKKFVQRTWKYLADDLTGHGSKIFLYIFKQYPNVKQLFQFRDLEGAELLKDANFKGHASRFMQSVGAVVDNVDDPELALAPLLIGLGKQHVHFMGFEPGYFDVFTEAMMHVWKQELGLKFNDEVAAAWKIVFDFIMEKLKEGYQIAVDEKKESEAKKTSPQK